ncbi:MAG: DNA polymerase III subunit beta [Rickettsiales bacterium]|nr:MAG: DNA polymerase III subunit beta [Rickettsiales bacterium]
MSGSENNNLEIVIQTKDLARALGFASSVVEKRNVMMELGNIKLVAKGGTLEIGATDMDLYLNQNIGAEIIREGGTTVSTQTLSEVIRKIPDDEITIKENVLANKLEIIGKNCHFELLTLPTEKFPEMEDIDTESSLSISCADLARIIEYTNFAMSSEETRYNLNGIYLHVKGAEFCSAATDGHRLAVASVPLSNKSEEFGVIVPSKTVTELLKITKDGQNIHSEMRIFLSSNKVKFECNNLVLISKLIDGVFPDYSTFIPADNESKLTVSKKLIASAIDRVATITVDKFRAVKLAIDNDSIKITASGEAKGAANEMVAFSDEKKDYCNFSGESLSVGFNPRYISDVFSSLTEEQVELYFKDEFSPVLIKTAQNPKDSFVIMPVKI